MSPPRTAAVVGLLVAVMAVSGACGSARPAVGTLTGKAVPCVGVIPPGSPPLRVTVEVRGGSGGGVVAHQTVPAGSTYRFDLAAGSYTVQDARGPTVSARVVTGRTTRGDLPHCK